MLKIPTLSVELLIPKEFTSFSTWLRQCLYDMKIVFFNIVGRIVIVLSTQILQSLISDKSV
jgi:hypothetical protein